MSRRCTVLFLLNTVKYISVVERGLESPLQYCCPVDPAFPWSGFVVALRKEIVSLFIMDLMDLSPPGSLRSHLQDFDNKILALKLYRNTVIPIACLPDKILCVIFSFLPGLLVPSPLSHVCHRWRESLLNLPCLWRYIDFSQLTLAGTAEIACPVEDGALAIEGCDTGKSKV